jgi:hypothetical protein
MRMPRQQRMVFTASGSVMVARRRIFASHLGQRSALSLPCAGSAVRSVPAPIALQALA